MPAIWIHRDEHDVVVSASVAEYTDPATLREWKSFGWKIELVDAPSITIGSKLPPDTHIIR